VQGRRFGRARKKRGPGIHTESGELWTARAERRKETTRGSRGEAQKRNEGRKLEERESDKRKVCKAGRLFKGHMENLRIF